MVQAHFLLILWVILITDGKAADEILIVAPKFVTATKPYNIYVRTTNLNKNITLSTNFRDERKVNFLARDFETFTPIKFKEGGSTFSNKTFFNFKVIMKHDGLCHDLNFNVTRLIKKKFIFVQMDKAIYKPSDDVKFRVITMDENLIPKKDNNINVTLVNPFGNHLGSKTDISEVNKLGLFNETFTLPSNPPEGKWGLFVAVGKANTTKSFTVQKYTLPFYEMKVYTRPKISIRDIELTVDVEAIYSFGGHVTGDARVTISSPNSCVSKNETIKNRKTFTFSIKDDLKIHTVSNHFMDLNVSVTFTDQMQLKTLNKSVMVNLFPKPICKIHLVNTTNYFEKAPFSFSIMVEDFDGNIVESNTSPVRAKFSNFGTNCQNNVLVDTLIKNSTASFKIQRIGTCGGDNNLHVEYKNCELKVKILNEQEDLNNLILRVSPLRPKLNKNLFISAYGKGTIVNSFWIAINHYGMIDEGSTKCGRGCDRIMFKVPVLKQSLPKVTIFVFALVNTPQDEKVHAQGKIDVTFDELSENYVSMEVPKDSIKPRTSFEMVIKSKEQAQVSLLAIDKSVTTLATGNDLEISDFVQSYSNYGSDLHVFQRSFAEPGRDCTKKDEELLELIKDKNEVVQTVNEDTLTPIANDDEEKDLDDQKEGRVTFIRSNFPETWLYETVLMGNDATKALSFTVPDTITTWIFTAFSLHSSGIALAAPQQLVVKQDYFVKINLPYAGRVGEILSVDAIVFNFLGDKKDVKTTVSFSVNGAGEKYEMIERISNNQSCQSRISNHKLNKKEIIAKYGQGTKVSFNFLPKVTGKIDIILAIETADKNYTDAMKKSIEIVNIGIREFDHNNFSSKSEIHNDYSSSTNFGECVSMSVGVTGVIVSKAFSYYEELVDLPKGCGEQTASNFNHNLLIYLYQNATNSLSQAVKRTALSNLHSDYTRVMSHTTSTGGVSLWHGQKTYSCLTAMATTVIGRAMHEGIVAVNYTFIKNSLDFLQNGTASGFSYCKGPNYDMTIPREKIASNVHQKSIILLAFLKSKSFIPDFNKLYSQFVGRQLTHITALVMLADPYASALAAYTLSWEGSFDSISKSKELLDQLKKENSHEEGEKRYFFINGTKYEKFNKLMSSYVALTYIKLNMTEEAKPIINWLSLSANVSISNLEPHHSAVLIEALTEAAKVLTKTKSNYTLAIETEDFASLWTVNKSNMHDYKYREISRGGHFLKLTANGEGYLSVDAFCEKYRKEAKSSNILDLEVKTKNVSAGINDIGSLEICIKCTLGECSDMVILEVQLQSGFVYVEILNEFHKVEHVKKVEVRKGSTIFNVYLDNIPKSTKTCTTFNVQQTSIGHNLKDGYVKAYIYNNYDKYASKPFNLATKICTYENEFSNLDWVKTFNDNSSLTL